MPIGPHPHLLLSGLEYDASLKKQLAQPALVIPLLTHVVGTAASGTVQLPSGSLMKDFDTLSLDARLSCEGSFDVDCDAWDHVVTVAATCTQTGRWPATSNPAYTGPMHLSEPDVTPNELGRWITPYRRRVGHWLTQVNPWLAVFAGGETCNITFVATDNGSPWVFDLNLRFTQSATARNVGLAPRPVQLVPLFNSTVVETFDSNYNRRPTLHVTAPTTMNLRAAQLTALITGHGDMEFAPSRHVFVVNGQTFNISFMEPLDQWACTTHVRPVKEFRKSLEHFGRGSMSLIILFIDVTQVRDGVEPNGAGAWWYGRDGWCNGWVVRPWTVRLLLFAKVTGSIPSC